MFSTRWYYCLINIQHHSNNHIQACKVCSKWPNLDGVVLSNIINYFLSSCLCKNLIKDVNVNVKNVHYLLGTRKDMSFVCTNSEVEATCCLAGFIFKTCICNV